jgi:hypothetical protein
MSSTCSSIDVSLNAVVGMFTGRVCLSLMARTEGGAEGEKAQEEELQWPLDHRSKGPSTEYPTTVGSF